MTSFLYRLGLAASRRRWLTLGVWVGAVIAIFAIGAGLGGKLTDDFNLPDSESQRAYDLLAERFPSASGTSAAVVFHATEGQLSAQAGAVTSTLEAIERQPDVVGVTDPLDPSSAGTLSEDGTIGYAQIAYDEPAVDLGTEPYERLLSVVERARSPGLEVEIGGEYASWGSQSEPGSSELIGLLAAMVILLIAFGSVVAMGLPIGTAVVGLATGTGLIFILAAFTTVPEFSTILASMIGLGVGIDYALFIVTRYRQNLQEGMDPRHAIGFATATAGQAVVFAGTTVAIALLGLWISGIAFVGMMATAAAIVVIVAVVAAVTLLPALLGFAGRGIDRLSVRRFRHNPDASAQNIWATWGREVERRPWRYFAGAILVLVTLALPFFSMQQGFPDDGTAPTSETRRQAYDLLSEGFGPGFNGPLLLAVEIDEGSVRDLEPLSEAIRATEGVAAVSPPQPNATGDAAIIQVIPTTSPQDEATTELVRRLREVTIPADRPQGVVVHVGGGTATFIDLSERVTNALPWFIGAVVLLSFLLLMVVFRSILVPLKAALLKPAVDRGRVRRNRGHLPVGLGPKPPRDRGIDPGRELRPDDDVRRPVRPVDGLRGVPALPGAGGVPEDREQRPERRDRHLDHREGDHECRADHDRRFPELRDAARPDRADVRHRARIRGPHRRDDRAGGARAGRDGAARRRELVASELAGSHPSEDAARGRRAGDGRGARRAVPRHLAVTPRHRSDAASRRWPIRRRRRPSRRRRPGAPRRR
jgi:RND superfamily putative drug exporter